MEVFNYTTNSKNSSNLFVNNNYVPITKSRPPFIKIEELDSDQNENKLFSFTEIDKFDEILYENFVKKKCNKVLTENKNYFDCFYYRMNKNLYLTDCDSAYKLEKFDCLSNRKPFVSTSSMGNINLRTRYKLQLVNVYRNETKKTSFTNHEINMNEECQSHNPSIIGNDIAASDKENKFFEGVFKKKGVSFQPTHMVKTEILKNRVSVKIRDLEENLPTVNNLKLLDDTLYNTYQNRLKSKTPSNSRPAFVDELFRKYDYQDLDPWKKVQNRTKDKSLCLSVIKDIYNKITNIFN